MIINNVHCITIKHHLTVRTRMLGDQGQASVRQDKSSAILPNPNQKAIPLTVHSNRPSRLRDPNERHRVKTRLSRKGKCRRERLELHSACQEPLKRGMGDVNEHSPDPQRHGQSPIRHAVAQPLTKSSRTAGRNGSSKNPENRGDRLKV